MYSITTANINVDTGTARVTVTDTVLVPLLDPRCQYTLMPILVQVFEQYGTFVLHDFPHMYFVVYHIECVMLVTRCFFLCRFHMIGLLVLFVQDIGDIWLELSKTVLYFKDRGGKEHWGPELGANLCFAVFTIQQ